MVAHFVSADYGWLQSPDGKETACVHFKAGKNREGYFTNENILKQTQTAMDLAINSIQMISMFLSLITQLLT